MLVRPMLVLEVPTACEPVFASPTYCPPPERGQISIEPLAAAPMVKLVPASSAASQTDTSTSWSVIALAMVLQMKPVFR